MVLVCIISLIIITIIVMLAQDSSKTTTKEKYGDAISHLANMAANGIDNISRGLTEPKDKRIIRQAKDVLASRNGRLYRFDWYNNEEMLNRLFLIDDDIKCALRDLGLSEERWNVLVREIFYLGIIRRESREKIDYSRRTEPYIRKHQIEEWIRRDGICRITVEYIIEALNYFHISVEEWIKYGDVVIEMYDLIEKHPDLKEYGFVTPIKPMANNLHTI